MFFKYKSLMYGVIADVDRNIIIASTIDPKKISEFQEEDSLVRVKSVNYSDISSVNITLSDIIKINEISPKALTENIEKHWEEIVVKLIEQIDRKDER